LLGCRQQVSSIEYQPSVPEGNPNYTTTEQDDEAYPRELRPYCRVGWINDGAEGICRPREPSAVHFRGTGLSLVWMGRYLANLALADTNATLAYLYNLTPAESMCWNSAELRLTVCSPVDGPKFFPPSKTA
jgi:hypothetical protein